MDSDQIKQQVVNQVNRWKRLRKLNGQTANISEGGINFFCLLIANIQNDVSPSWVNLNINNPDILQEEAIALIPTALNQVVDTIGSRNNIEISSWEIWHSLSRILDKLCFIPKKSGNG